MGSGDTKVCPMCAETIKAQAKLCPFCRTKQGRYLLLRHELLYGWSTVILLIATVVFIKSLIPKEDGIVGGRSFVGHRDDLLVCDTSITGDASRSEHWLTGVVTNRGQYPWRVHELEVRFLDGQGNLLDVCHVEVKDAFVVQPHQTHGFRVRLGQSAFINSDVLHRVRVQVASDGTRPWTKD